MLEQLGQYKILDRIGAGGMGEVYRARDTRLGRTVAIKVLPEDLAADPDRRERLLREARAAAALSHPNIAALFEVGDDQGHLFLAFEYIRGDTLKTVLSGGPLNPRHALDYAIQLADALADAHGEGVVHRDIKPDNIIITPKDKAKILDFGLATWTSGGAEREHAATMIKTGAGVVLGTVAYMSPEQALGHSIDHRTDIFSLGIVLVEMLTGRRPFTGATPTALSLQIVQAPAPAPSAVKKDVPRELDAIVARALAKKPDDRYQAAAPLAAELRSVAAILDTRDGVIEPPTVTGARRRRRRAGATAVFALLAAAVVGAFVLLLIGGRQSIARAWKHTLGPAPPPVIAVVPFDTEAGQEFFADGLAEDLISRLGQTPGLKVIGRSATRSYRGRAPRDVAKELGAGVVLTGSVSRQADVVKVSLELIDPDDGTDLWTRQYTPQARDIFQTQAQVADDVTQALRVALHATPSSERARARLVDPRAYELYLRGRQAMAERRLPDAIAAFGEAIKADAGLAEAYAGQAEAMDLDVAFNGAPNDEARRLALKNAAERAYQLDPNLPQSSLAMGLASDSLAAALGYMRHAIESDPSFTEGYHQIGDQIADFDPDLAIRFYRRSLQIDPRYGQSWLDIVATLMAVNRWDEVHREIDSPTHPPVSRVVGTQALIDVFEGHPDRAIEKLRTIPVLHDVAPAWLNYVTALRAAGRRTDAFGEARALVARFPRSCEGRALLAGLTFELRGTEPARRLAGPIQRRARQESAAPDEVRCAALAAAATNDAADLGAIFDRIAANELFLRYWALQVFGVTGRMMLSGRAYPWTEVLKRPSITPARQRLDAAYARERDAARRVLAGLLDQ